MSNDEFMLGVVESRLAEVEFGSERHLSLMRTKEILVSRIAHRKKIVASGLILNGVVLGVDGD